MINHLPEWLCGRIHSLSRTIKWTQNKLPSCFPFLFLDLLAAVASVTLNDVDNLPLSLYCLKLSICGLNLAASTVENLVGRVGGLCEALNGRKAHRLRSSGPIPAISTGLGVACPGRALWTGRRMFWLWSFPLVALSTKLVLLQGFWWDFCLPGPAISVFISSFFSWRVVHCSDFISSIWFQNFIQVGWGVPILTAAEFGGQAKPFLHSLMCVSGRCWQEPGVSETLFKEHQPSVEKYAHILSVFLEVFLSLKFWAQFIWIDLGNWVSTTTHAVSGTHKLGTSVTE